MNFPQLNSVTVNKNTIGTFYGLNEQDITGEQEFSDMQNITSDLYPGLSMRKARGEVIKTLTKPNGLFYKNGLVYVDGTDLYYKGTKVGTVEDSEKKMVGMGAYVCIWPDKVVYNTADNTLKKIEASYTQSGDITVAPVSTGSTYVKISGTGIGKNFSRNDAVVLSGFTTYPDQLNVSKVIKEISDDYIVVIATTSDGEALASFTQGSGVTVKRTCPDMDFICEHNNRLWGCSSKNHEIYASKLGDPLNWNAFESISTDSYALSIGSDGDFTGCLAHQGYVVFFKEDYIHTIYGTKPSNFTLDTIQARGPVKGCEKSLTHVDESVFYVARNAVMMFQGSTPAPISDKLKMDVIEATAGQFNSKYYVSAKDSEGVWHLYVYDVRRSSETEQSLWYKEDNLHMLFTAFGEGKLYLIDEKGTLETISQDTYEKNGEWNLVSGIQEDGSINRKKLHKMQFYIELDKGTLFEVYLKYRDEVEWLRVAHLTATKRDTYLVPVPLRRAGNYQYRLHGYGRFKLFALSKTVEAGSDRK